MSKWYKLDNAAKIYPPVLHRYWASMFRLSIDLTEEVDVNILEQAQINTLKRMPSFSCTLKAGLFWYYLEHIEGNPPIYKDIVNPLQKINFKKNNKFLYRILYYKNRIAVEIFHSLTDGTGGVTFLLTLVNEYLHLKYGTDVVSDKYILNINQQPDSQEFEDAFLRYSDDSIIPIREEVSYKIKGGDVPFNRLLITSGSIDTSLLKQKAKEYGVTLSIFLGAVLLYSAYKTSKLDKRQTKRKIKISIPVNLRNFFPTKTLRNFSSFVNPGLYPQLGEYSFEEVLKIVQSYFSMYVNEKQLKGKFNFNVAAEKNLFIRLTPLFIKNPILKFSYYFSGDNYYCTTISNLGNITLPDEIGKFITRIDFMLGRQLTKRTMCGCVSYNNKTIINFSSTLKEANIEYYFFTTLVKMGIPVYIESNRRS